MLSIERVSFSYAPHGKQVLNDVSLTVQAGQIVALVGPSGCGKTTLLNLVAKALRPQSGSIAWWDQQSFRCAYVLQSPALMPWLTVRENALFGALVGKVLDSSKERLAASLLQEYGLGQFVSHYPASLSGGMQQRLSVIRAIVASTPVALLDEPFTGTDPILRRQLFAGLLSATAETSLAALLVSHDPWDVAAMADEAVILGGRPATVVSRINNPLTLAERRVSLKRSSTALLDFVAAIIEGLEAAAVL